MKSNKGFSLVELIVVIAIMAIIAAVAIPVFSGYIGKANKAADDDFMAQVEYAVKLANVKTADFSAGTITVTITEGKPTAISYGTGATAVSVASTDKDGEDVVKSDIAKAIDWNYTFKSYESATITNGVVSGS